MTVLRGVAFSPAGVLNGQRVIGEITLTVSPVVIAEIDARAGAEYTTTITSSSILLKRDDGTVLATPSNVALSVTFASLQRVAGIDKRLIFCTYSNAAFDGPMYLCAWEKVGAATLDPVPPPAPPAGVPGGLLARYYNNLDLVGEPVYTATEVPFIADRTPGAPRPGVSGEFSARFTGAIRFPVSGQYRFFFRVDDHIRITVQGELLFDKWGGNAAGDDYTRAKDYVAGTDYLLWIDFRDTRGTATLDVYTQLFTAGVPQAPVPLQASQLYASLPDNVPPINIPPQGRHFVELINRYP